MSGILHARRPAQLVVDELIVATGFRPDLAMLREVRLALDPWPECAAGVGPPIHLNLHSCGTVRLDGAAPWTARPATLILR